MLKKILEVNMFKKIAVVVAVLFVLSLSLIAADKAAPAPLSKEVASLLDKKILLVKELVKGKNIVDAVIAANLKNAAITDAEISKLDKAWIASKGLTEAIKPYLKNKCAITLMEFQEKNEGYPEMFVTDKKGLIVGETNKTSDYLQADEGWWQNTYNEGKGADVMGNVEFDDSSKSEVIAISVPVYTADGKEIVGVIKAAVDITAIKSELK